MVFEVEPSDLIVLVDGDRTSKGDLRILELSPGKHDVTIISRNVSVGGATFSIFGDRLFFSGGNNIIARGTIDTTDQTEFKIVKSQPSRAIKLSSKNGQEPLDERSTHKFTIPLPEDFVASYRIPCKSLRPEIRTD
ncbi:MAG: hypothetical protein U5O39_09965 [Gammaproteobacteria bacterium]|nr:hypothetical protein [Gammaproteobacteria bacterium]